MLYNGHMHSRTSMLISEYLLCFSWISLGYWGFGCQYHWKDWLERVVSEMAYYVLTVDGDVKIYRLWTDIKNAVFTGQQWT